MLQYHVSGRARQYVYAHQYVRVIRFDSDVTYLALVSQTRFYFRAGRYRLQYKRPHGKERLYCKR